MKEHTISTEQQGTVTFTGELLGVSTSESEWHDHEEQYLPSGSRDGSGRKRRCAGCRWHEAYIYRKQDGTFVLHTVGQTIVPGEIPYGRIVESTSAFEILERAVVRASTPYLPATTARALAQAADTDDKIREAYVNRAVV